MAAPLPHTLESDDGGNTESDSDDNAGMNRRKRFAWEIDDDGNAQPDFRARCAVCRELFETAGERNDHLDEEHEL